MVSKIHRNGLDHGFTDISQGKERIVSYPGTSQFNSRGISACGLAAMNFARVLFELIHVYGQERPADVLRAITSKETIQVSVSGQCLILLTTHCIRWVLLLLVEHEQ
jgi:hypothetical protein